MKLYYTVLFFLSAFLCHANDNTTFDHIIVTAQAESIVIPTKTVSTKEIQFNQAEHISNITNYYSGIQIHRGNGIEHLTAMRSPVLTGGAGAGSFLYLMDNIPLRSPGFGNINGLFEVSTDFAELIEIFPGPGDLSHGINAQHGTINLISMSPSSYPERKLKISSNSNKSIFTTYTQSNSCSSGGYRVSANLTHDPGFRASSSLNNQFLTFRKDWISSQMNRELVILAQNLDQETAGYIEGYKSYKNYATSKSNPDPDAYRKSRAIRAHHKFRWNFPKSSNLTITPFLRYTQMDFLMHFLPSKALEETKHYSLGIKSSYDKKISDSSSLYFGVDSEYTQGFLKETQTVDPGIPSFPVGTHFDYKIESIMLSSFISYSKTFWRSLPISTGIRLDSLTYVYDNQIQTDLFGKYQRISDRTNSFLGITPQVNASYHFTDHTKLFLKLRRRSRPPQTTDIYRLESNQIPDQVNEETIDSIELGFSQSNFKLSSFYMKKRNFFFRDVDGFNVVGGKTIHYGIETELTIKLTAKTYFSINYTYAQHRYDFNNSVSSTSNSTEAIQDGDYIDSAPKIFGNIRFGCNFSQRSKAEIEWINMGKYYIDASNEHLYAGHNILNLRFESAISSKLTLFAKISNLLNSRYAERADYFRSTYRYFPGEGINVRAGMSLVF